jgi:hypothetical protein
VATPVESGGQGAAGHVACPATPLYGLLDTQVIARIAQSMKNMKGVA